MLIKAGSRKLEVVSSGRKAKNLCTLYFVLCTLNFSLSTNAQCAMCRAALTSEGNKAKAEAINDGIIFLMAVPYVLVGIVGYLVYRIFKKKN